MTMTDTTTVPMDTISAKLKWLDDRYWRFGQEEVLDDALLDLFEVDDAGQMTAQPRRDPLTGETEGLAILGTSGGGKTALLKRTLRVNPILTEFSVESPGNTLFITAPPEASIKKLAEIILERTGYKKIDPRLRSADAWEMARHRLGIVGICAVVIDECHHILRSGQGRDVLAAIQALKHIMQSRHPVTLIIAGVPALRDALLSEPSGETYRRFSELHLADIRPGTRSAQLFDTNFKKSAAMIEVVLDDEACFPDRILFATGGEIGKSVKLAKNILRDAVTRNRIALNLARAERVFLKSNVQYSMTPFAQAPWPEVKQELEATGWATQ